MASGACRTGGTVELGTLAMIGVIADPAEHSVVSEFFELFKTPWEFYHSDRRYDVLLCAGDGQFEGSAKLMLFYSSRRIRFDDQQKIHTGTYRKHSYVLWHQG